MGGTSMDDDLILYVSFIHNNSIYLNFLQHQHFVRAMVYIFYMRSEMRSSFT